MDELSKKKKEKKQRYGCSRLIMVCVVMYALLTISSYFLERFYGIFGPTVARSSNIWSTHWRVTNLIERQDTHKDFQLDVRR